MLWKQNRSLFCTKLSFIFRLLSFELSFGFSSWYETFSGRETKAFRLLTKHENSIVALKMLLTNRESFKNCILWHNKDNEILFLLHIDGIFFKLLHFENFPWENSCNVFVQLLNPFVVENLHVYFGILWCWFECLWLILNLY